MGEDCRSVIYFDDCAAVLFLKNNHFRGRSRALILFREMRSTNPLVLHDCIWHFWTLQSIDHSIFHNRIWHFPICGKSDLQPWFGKYIWKSGILFLWTKKSTFLKTGKSQDLSSFFRTMESVYCSCMKSSVNTERKKVYKIEQKYLTFSKKSINITL